MELSDSIIKSSFHSFLSESHEASHSKLRKLVKIAERYGNATSNELIKFSVNRTRAIGIRMYR